MVSWQTLLLEVLVGGMDNHDIANAAHSPAGLLLLIPCGVEGNISLISHHDQFLGNLANPDGLRLASDVQGPISLGWGFNTIRGNRKTHVRFA